MQVTRSKTATSTISSIFKPKSISTRPLPLKFESPTVYKANERSLNRFVESAKVDEIRILHTKLKTIPFGIFEFWRKPHQQCFRENRWLAQKSGDEVENIARHVALNCIRVNKVFRTEHTSLKEFFQNNNRFWASRIREAFPEETSEIALEIDEYPMVIFLYTSRKSVQFPRRRLQFRGLLA